MSIHLNITASLILYLIFTVPVEAQLKKEIDKIILSLPSTTSTSIFIYNPINMDTIYQKDIHAPFIPASNIKLVTTAAALSILGGDYFLSTKLLTDDPITTDSVINGNIYLKGYGNSKFSSKEINDFTDKLNQMGIREITGNIICDDSYFDTNFSQGTVFIDGQSSLTVPPVSALALDRNTIYLTLIPSNEIGEKLDYRYTPFYPFINVNMDARVTRFKSEPRVSYRFDGDIITVRVLGGMYYRQKNNSYLIYIENPALYCGLAFQSRLIKSGITVSGKLLEGKTPLNTYEITFAEIMVKDLLPEINKKSDNYLAESLFKSLGAEYSKEVGNKFFASEAITKFLQEKNISSDDVKIDDGSGISRSNRVTANLLVRLLDCIYKDKVNFSTFFNSLSIAGIDGTLKDRFAGTDIENNFHGKTGTIYGISNITGYFTTKENQIFIISILMSFDEGGTEYHQGIQNKIIQLVSE